MGVFLCFAIGDINIFTPILTGSHNFSRLGTCISVISLVRHFLLSQSCPTLKSQAYSLGSTLLPLWFMAHRDVLVLVAAFPLRICVQTCPTVFKLSLKVVWSFFFSLSPCISIVQNGVHYDVTPCAHIMFFAYLPCILPYHPNL